MKTDVSAKYLVGIVLIVAIVGFVSLLANSGATLVGATTSSTCSDTDSSSIPSFNWLVKGKVSGGLWKTTNKAYTLDTDYCNPKWFLVEYYCSDSTHAFSTTQSCATVVGAGSVCSAGACTPLTDSDGDGVYDASDKCPGYDDTVDTDSDGTPDGCDTDDDGDGYSDADETAAGTNPLDATSYPVALPDLVFASLTISWKPGGVAYITSNGTVAKSNVTANVTLGIKNDGTAAVGSTVRSKQKIVIVSASGTYFLSWYAGDSELKSLAAGATREVTDKTSPNAPLLFELYTNSSTTLPYNYSIDYYSYVSGSTWFGVNESNEVNNNGTGSYTLSGSGITFIAAECATNKDCPTDCACSTTDYNCYETTYSGGSTYLTTTEC